MNNNQIENLLAPHNFTPFHNVEGKLSIADLFSGTDHCGIYVLHFANDDYYVGQSVDIATRYKQHSKNHEDITQISYTLIPKSELNRVELDLITKFENEGIRLRNVFLTSIPLEETDLKKLISDEEQEIWLEDSNAKPKVSQRRDLETHRHKQSWKYKKLLTMDEYTEIMTIVREYLSFAIIEPNLTEMDFWRLSCLPNNGLSQRTDLVRVNIYMQEVMSITKDNIGIFVTLQVAKSPLGNIHLARIKYLFKGVFIMGNPYKSGGADQVRLVIFSTKAARNLLQDSKIRTAIKVLNIRLMNKGAGSNILSHCVDLADDGLRGL